VPASAGRLTRTLGLAIDATALPPHEYRSPNFKSRVVNTREEVCRGREAFFSFDSNLTQCALVFEDDGDCGYLYVLDSGQKIEEAVFVYKFDPAKPTRSEALDVSWSVDGWVARVQLGDELVALFNFRSKKTLQLLKLPVPASLVPVAARRGRGRLPYPAVKQGLSKPQRARPNPSLKRSANGRLPSPADGTPSRGRSPFHSSNFLC